MKNDTQKRFKLKPAKSQTARAGKGKKPLFRTSSATGTKADPVYEGIVKNGVVHLQNGATLKDGTRVSIEPQPRDAEQKNSSFAERYREFIGAIKGMPPDFAENHDHYIHGTPKRK